MKAFTKIVKKAVLHFELPAGLNEKLEEVSIESFQAFHAIACYIPHRIKTLCL